jgi:hypothetical protein
MRWDTESRTNGCSVSSWEDACVHGAEQLGGGWALGSKPARDGEPAIDGVSGEVLTSERRRSSRACEDDGARALAPSCDLSCPRRRRDGGLLELASAATHYRNRALCRTAKGRKRTTPPWPCAFSQSARQRAPGSFLPGKELCRAFWEKVTHGTVGCRA